ncbi:MAG: SprT family zinc-dependent metalloprotease [Steroidobacteraceae bacterium]
MDHRARIADNPLPAAQLALWEAPGADAPRVRFSARARRVAVRVHLDGGVELVVPRGVSERRARAFFDSRRQWVQEQVRRRRALAQPPAPFPPGVLDLPAIGERWKLHLGAGPGRARITQQGEGWLSLRGQGDARALQQALRRWLSERAQQTFEPRLAELARQFGFDYRLLRVRLQRSRWGSCSTRGTISLNLALLFQTPEVLRYLMCHELAHTRHMNHSAAFWRCVAACEPQWQRLDRSLAEGWRRVPQWLLQRAGES